MSKNNAYNEHIRVLDKRIKKLTQGGIQPHEKPRLIQLHRQITKWRQARRRNTAGPNIFPYEVRSSDTKTKGAPMATTNRLPKVSQKYKNREARNRSLTPAQRRRRAAVGREERNRSQGAQDITVPRAPKAPVSRGTPAEQLASKFSAFAHRGKLTKDLGGGNYQNTKTGQSFKLNARGDHVYADGRTVKRRKTWRPNAPKGPAAL